MKLWCGARWLVIRSSSWNASSLRSREHVENKTVNNLHSPKSAFHCSVDQSSYVRCAWYNSKLYCILPTRNARPPSACLIYDVQQRDHVVCNRVCIATWENRVRVNRLFSGSPFFRRRRRSCTTVVYSRLPEISSHKFSSGLNPCSGRACHSHATSFGSK